MIAIGLDVSLTATGVAVITGSPPVAHTYVYRTYPDDGSITGRRDRIGGIVGAVLPVCEGADLLAVEGPSYHSVGGKPHDRSGLWWALVGALSARGVPIAEVPPTVRMLWAHGKGRATKRQVMVGVGIAWPDVAIPDDNAADALVLASMAAQRLGLLEMESAHHRLAATSVHWPALEIV